MSPILGIHHITALAGDPQRNADFYVSILGLRLVKRSINQDAPDIYHLYYGDAAGSPGTAITFFPFGRAARGKRGNGEISRVSFAVPSGSVQFWHEHLKKHHVSHSALSERMGDTFIVFPDPDGLMIELVFTERQTLEAPWNGSPVPAEHAIKALYGVTMNLADHTSTADVLEHLFGATLLRHEGPVYRYSLGVSETAAMIDLEVDPSLHHARSSAGSVHHIAWRVKDDRSHGEWYSRVTESGLHPSEIIDRFYFHSIYFREPGGILYEIATDNPGFTVDEPIETLGSTLVLPPWYEEQRSSIEQALPPLRDPMLTGQEQE